MHKYHVSAGRKLDVHTELWGADKSELFQTVAGSALDCLRFQVPAWTVTSVFVCTLMVPAQLLAQAV